MADPRVDLLPDDPDLTECDREAIHLLGRVQHYGALIAVSSDWIVAHASENCADLLDLPAGILIGTSLSDHLSERSLHDLRTKMQTLSQLSSGARIFSFPLFDDQRLFDISIHSIDRHYVFEFEPRDAGGPAMRNDAVMVQALIARVQRHPTLDGMSKEAARAVRALTNFDRVMVYRFGPDGDGSVIAEAMAPGQDPYLGLRYPATDIPKQARALYERNLLRIIADVDGETSPVLPPYGPSGDRPLDLSMATTRAVSEVHLQYLRNMGVRASMSVSILKQGKLWGLIACHHRTPMHVDFERRSAVELFAQLFNYELSQLEMNEELQELDRARALQDRLMSQLVGRRDLFASLDYLFDELSEVIQFDGLAIFSDGAYEARAEAPTEQEFGELARFLNTRATGEVFATDKIARYFGGDMPFGDLVAGVLSLPLSRTPRDYVVLFRREIVQSVTWAGNPDKAAEPAADGRRLTPRKSFEAWQEIVRGRSSQWKRSELRMAESVRVTLLEVLLKLADQEGMAERKAREKQEVLIDELNHRVRNILNLIRGLLAHRPDGVATVESYRQVLDARIRALAYAHDQLTATDYGWMSARALIQSEIRAFVTDRAGQIDLRGDDVNVSPNAFTTLALVMHELVTNSVKHGALGSDAGRVDIVLDHDDDLGLRLDWTESGGPAVVPPSRVGFGRTIIERSVPFELEGTAEVVFAPTGLRASYTIPGPHVEPGGGTPASADLGPDPAAALARIEGEALVLEDNLIIAMDCADMLASLGASEVHTAGGLREAARILDTHPIAFALIDVNLGREMSDPIVRRCVAEGIPTVLATGYGLGGEALRRFRDVPVLRKPYATAALQQVLARMMAARG